jgi:hypothetical protein
VDPGEAQSKISESRRKGNGKRNKREEILLRGESKQTKRKPWRKRSKAETGNNTSKNTKNKA